MGKSSGGSQGTPGTQTVVNQSSPPPAFLNAYTNLTNQAQNVANTPLQQYPGSLVAGFTPQQQQAFSTVQNLQGIGVPFTNAATAEIGNATQPLWPSLPSFDVSGLPQQGISSIATGQQYAQAAAQPIGQMAYPYAQIATGAAQNLPGNAYPYAGLATQPINTNPYTGFGLGTAQGTYNQFAPGGLLQNQVGQYTGFAGNTAGNLPGQVAPSTGLASWFAQNLPGQVAPSTGLASGIAQGLPGQVAPSTGLASGIAQNLPGQVAPSTGLASGIAQNLQGGAAPYGNIATGAAQGLNVNPEISSATQPLSTPGYDTLGTYLSPYTQNVTSALQGLFNQQNATQQSQIRGNAAAQGALGGDREAVAQALTAGQQQRSEAPTLAQTLQQGFQQAQGELNTEQQLALQQGVSQGQLGLGAGQLATTAAQTQGQLGLGAGQLYTQAGTAAGQLGLGAGQLTTQAGLGAGQLGLGAGQLTTQAGTAAGQLGLGAGQLTTQAGLGAGQLGLGAGQLTEQTGLGAGQLGLGAGQLTSQTGLGAGQLQLGAGQLGLGAGQLYTQGALGQGQLGLGAGQLITQAGAEQGQLGLGAGQLMTSALGTQGQLGLGAAQTNLAAGQGYMGEFNQQQQAQMAAEQANAWLASQGAFALGSLGSQAQQQGLAGASAEEQTGALQQALEQQQLNIPYEQFTQQQAYPFQTTNFLAPIVEGLGSQAGGTSATTSPGPSAVSQVAGLGLAGLGTVGLTGGFGSNGWLTNAFSGGSGLNFGAGIPFDASAAGIAGATLPGDVAATPPALDALSLAALGFGAKQGGRIGLQGGGPVTPFALPQVSNGGLGSPAIPSLNLNYLTPSQPMRGPGPPRAPQVASSNTAPGFDPATILKDLSMVKGIENLGGGFGSPTNGSQFGGRIKSGMPSIGHGLGSGHIAIPHIGGAAHLGTGIRHPAIGMHFQSGGGTDDDTTYDDFIRVQEGQPLRSGGRVGFQAGGGLADLTAATPISGASPNIQGMYQKLSQMNLEQLQEYLARVGQGSGMGQLAQRAIQAKLMSPGAGTAPVDTTIGLGSLAGGTTTQTQPQGAGLGQGFQGGGTVTSGGPGLAAQTSHTSISTLDSNIGSWGQAYGAGGADPNIYTGSNAEIAAANNFINAQDWSAPNAVQNVESGLANWTKTYDAGGANPNIYTGSDAAQNAINNYLNAWGGPAPPASASGSGGGSGAGSTPTSLPAASIPQQPIPQVPGSLAPPPALNPGFNFAPPPPVNPFANIAPPPPLNVGSAQASQPLSPIPITPPQISASALLSPTFNPNTWMNPLPQLPIPGGALAGGARGGSVGRHGFQEGGEASADIPPASASADLTPLTDADFARMRASEVTDSAVDAVRSAQAATAQIPQDSKGAGADLPPIPRHAFETTTTFPYMEKQLSPSPFESAVAGLKTAGRNLNYEPGSTQDPDRSFRELMQLRGTPVGETTAAITPSPSAPSTKAGPGAEPAATIVPAESGITEDPTRSVARNLPLDQASHTTRTIPLGPQDTDTSTQPSATTPTTMPAAGAPTKGVPSGPRQLVSTAPAAGQEPASPIEPSKFGPVAKTISDEANRQGIPVSLALKTAQIESGMGTNLGKLNNIFQLNSDNWRDMGGGDMGNMNTQVEHGIKALAQEQGQARQALGREPQEWETYLFHQQGAGGAPALLKAPPGTSAVDALTPAYKGNRQMAMSAIIGNGGELTMTAQQFADLQRQRFEGFGSRLNLGATMMAGSAPDGNSGIGEGAGKGPAISGVSTLEAPTHQAPQPTQFHSQASDILSSPWMVPLTVGAGMLASRSPFPGVALGEGLETGVKVLGQQEGADLHRMNLEQQGAHLADTALEWRDKLGAEKEQHAAQQAHWADQLNLTDKEFNQRVQQHADTMGLDYAKLGVEEKRNVELATYREELAKIHEAATSKAVGSTYGQKDPSDQNSPWGTWITHADGTQTFNEGQGAPKEHTGAQGQFEAKRQAYRTLHQGEPNVEQEALDFAAGKKALTPTDYAKLVQQEVHDLRANSPGQTITDAEAERNVQRRLGHTPGSQNTAKLPTQTAAPVVPPLPAGVPQGSQYSPSLKRWRDPQGKMYDADGNSVPP